MPKSTSNQLAAPAIVNAVLRSPGRQLNEGNRADYQAKFNFDFSRVRVHDDPEAAQSARAVSAQAYTVGRHIVFASNRYAPETNAGKRLLAHELAHVVQQNAAAEIANPTVAAPHDIHERQADRTGRRQPESGAALMGAPTLDRGIPVQLQRQADSDNDLTQTPLPQPVGGGPSTTPSTGGQNLAKEQVVNVEVRDNGVTPWSHEYPIDLNGNLRIPSIGNIAAAGKSLVQVRQDILNALITGGIFTNPTVNTSLSSKTVPYTQKLAAGDTIQLRVLDIGGNVDPSSGSYSVDSTGQLHLPYIGNVTAAGMTLAALENQIETGISTGKILINPVVSVSFVRLNS